MNIGVPVIYNSRLTDLSIVLGETVGFPVLEYVEFKKSAIEIIKNYEQFKNNVSIRREEIEWDSSVKLKFKEYLANYFVDL